MLGQSKGTTRKASAYNSQAKGNLRILVLSCRVAELEPLQFGKLKIRAHSFFFLFLTKFDPNFPVLFSADATLTLKAYLDFFIVTKFWHAIL
jgi:hypothetical protein